MASQQCSAPSREHHRLGTLARLACNAGHVGEVCTPLAAVQTVLPELTYAYALHMQRISTRSGLGVPRCFWAAGFEMKSSSSQSRRLWDGKQSVLGIAPGRGGRALQGWAQSGHLAL